MMTPEQFEDLKGTIATRLRSVEQQAATALVAIDEALTPLDEIEDEARELLERMDKASAKVPFGLLAYCYAKGMRRAQGAVVGFDGSFNDEFEEIAEDVVERLTAKYVRPALDAVSKVYPTVQQLLQDVQNYALTLRYFSNSEPLLAQFARILEPPWFLSPQVDDLTPKGSWRLHPHYASMPYRLAPHIEIIGRRRASVNTLNLLRSKLKSLRSLIETSLTELAFTTPRAEPAAVPSTWYDYSVTVGENSKIEGSAVGPDASIQRRML